MLLARCCWEKEPSTASQFNSRSCIILHIFFEFKPFCRNIFVDIFEFRAYLERDREIT
jgi:hypothetical protein